MRCPFCSHLDTRVLDSRLADGGDRVWRRRECPECHRRFSTNERAELEIVVVKKDGRREPYSKQKLMLGIQRACQKRPISSNAIEALVARIEQDIRSRNELEVSSRLIGELVMRRLKKLDEVAYIRFASVYRQFADVSEFQQELSKLKPKRGKSR